MNADTPHRILFAELSMTGVYHAGVNSGLIRVMRKVFPEAEPVFYGEKSHTEACRGRLADVRIRFRKLPFFPAARKSTLLLRDFLGCFYAFWILAAARKTDAVFINNLLPLTHWTLFLWNKLFRRRLFITLHGQMEAFRSDTPLRGTKHYFRLTGPIFRRDRSTRYVILGEPVYREIARLFSPRPRPVVIDHPYDYDYRAEPPVYAYPLRFGQIGTGNRGKGTQHLFELGERLREEIEAGKIEISLIGRLDPELRASANPWVKWHEEPLSAPDFEREINRLHYALLLRDAQTGRATPSGSFFDAVKYGKPFLSLDHPFVAHYAGRFPGCGEVYSSVEEVADAIRGLVRANDASAYRRQTAASFDRARQELAIETIAESFKRQIFSCFLLC